MNEPLLSSNRRVFSYSWLAGMALSLSALSGAHAAATMATGLTSSVGYNEYMVSESIMETCRETNRCPEINIKHIDTSAPWINTIVNQRVDSMVVNNALNQENPVKGAIKKAQVQAAIDDFAKKQLADMPKDSNLTYELDITPSYAGHIGVTELFSIDNYAYLGGAHGLPYREYLVFDTQTKRQVTLDDMLLPKQKPRFEALAHDAYRKWVKTMTDDVASYESSWPFSLSSNVTLDTTGMRILYQPYDIAPYASGMPELHIPYSQLKGVIKPNYLPK